MFKKLLLFTSLLVVFVSFTLSAQIDPVVIETVPDRVGRKIFLELFGDFFLTLAMFSTAATGVTAFVINQVKFLRDTQPVIKQLVAIIIGLALALIGHFVQVGIFITMDLSAAIMTGVTVGLGSNSIWDFFNGLSKLRRVKRKTGVSNLSD